MVNIRRDSHLLFYAYTLTSVEKYRDNRNLPTRRGQGKRQLLPRSLKPIVLRSALYIGVQRWNQLKPEYSELQDLTDFKISIKKNSPKCLMNVE